MELTFAAQSLAFALAVVLGAAMGAAYIVLRLLRLTFGFGKILTAVCDTAFMLLFSLCLFFFSLSYLSGYFRLYLIPAAALGFAACMLTLGKAVDLVLSPVIGFVHSTLQKIFTKLKIFAKKLLKTACKLLYNNISIKGYKTGSLPINKEKDEYEDKKAKNKKG